MKYSKILLLITVFPFLFSCSTYYKFSNIGELSMAATRNIDNSKDYVELRTYAGISNSDISAAVTTSKTGKIKKKNPIIKEVNVYKANNLQDAIDKVVKSTPGGEFMYNLKLYLVTQYSGFKGSHINRYYIASGDVWGIRNDNTNIKGFHKSDSVAFTYTKDLRKEIGTKNFNGEINKQYKGLIIGLKGSFATIKLDNGTVVNIPYTYLINVGK